MPESAEPAPVPLDLPTLSDAPPSVPAAPPPPPQNTEPIQTPAPSDPLATCGDAAEATFPAPLDGLVVPGYEILGVLGRGGMAIVYRARQKGLKRLVALKMILSGAFADAEDRSRFQSEAAAVARLQHPNIIQIHEVGLAEGRPFFSMEYAQGGSLAQRLQGSPLPQREAALLLEPLAQAMHFAHQQSVIHRDLKPANILLAARGSMDGSRPQAADLIPKVSDFGLAKLLDDQSGQTRSNAILGTPSYMAPEQAAGHAREVGPATDVYALGAILYEMLAGRPPFRGESIPETLDQVRHQEPVPPSRLQPKVSRDLETICLKCLHKEPTGRYESAAALGADLHCYLAGEPIRARRAGTVERLWRWCRREPVVASLLAALALMFILGFALVTWKGLAEARANQAAQEAAGVAFAEKVHADQARREAELLTARALLDAAISQGDGGDVDRALLMFADGLELADRIGNTDLQHVFRRNLTGWRSQLGRLRARLPHGNWVWAVAYRPDGRQFATASTDKTVRQWDAETTQPIGEPLRHQYPVWAVAYSPDGRTLLTGSGDSDKDDAGEAQLWDAAGGKPLGPPLLRGRFVNSVAFSSDGRMILTLASGQAQLWKAGDAQRIGVPQTPTLTALLLPHVGEVRTAIFSPDGKLVLTGGTDGTARLWQTDTGRPFGPPLRHGTPDDKHAIRVAAAAFSPDGQLVVTGSQAVDLAAKRYIGGEARLWRVATGAAVGEPWPHRGPVKAIAFSPNGQRVLTGGIVSEGRQPANLGGEARLWDIPTGQPIGQPMEQTRPVWTVAFSPDGRTLLTGSEASQTTFWSAATASPLGKTFNSHGNALVAAFGPDSRTALIGHSYDDGPAEIFEAPQGRGVALTPWHGGWADGLAITPDGRFLLAGYSNSAACLYEVATQQRKGSPWAHGSYVVAVAVSSDNRLAVTGCGDGKGRLWDLATGKLHGPPLSHPGTVRDVAFSPDNRLVLTLGEDGTVRLWDVASGAAHGSPLHQPGVIRARFSPDGRSVLLGGSRVHAQEWDVATGKPVGLSLQTTLDGSTNAFSADGRHFLMIGAGLHMAQAWLLDRGTGEILVPPLQQRDGVSTAVFSPDGRLIATGGLGGSLMLWDAATGRRLGPVYQHPSMVLGIAFDPEGKWLATACRDNIVRFWDVPAPATGEPGPIKRWVQALTGCTLTAEGLMPALEPKALLTLRRELEAAGSEPFPPLVHPKQ
jgi:WD40 repeat protein/serine/threonine protein kinase